MTEYNLYRGSIFHCIEDGSNVQPIYFPDGLLVVSGGKILEVGEYSILSAKFNSGESIVHFKDSLIMPGFIDCHIHYPQYKVISSYGTSLLEWLNKYTFVEEQKLSLIHI